MVKERMIVTTSKGLYKYLLRECQKLPKDAQEFYKHSIRQVRLLWQRMFQSETCGACSFMDVSDSGWL